MNSKPKTIQEEVSDLINRYLYKYVLVPYYENDPNFHKDDHINKLLNNKELVFEELCLPEHMREYVYYIIDTNVVDNSHGAIRNKTIDRYIIQQFIGYTIDDIHFNDKEKLIKEVKSKLTTHGFPFSIIKLVESIINFKYPDFVSTYKWINPTYEESKPINSLSFNDFSKEWLDQLDSLEDIYSIDDFNTEKNMVLQTDSSNLLCSAILE